MSLLKDFSFLLIILFIVIARSFKIIIKKKLKKNSILNIYKTFQIRKN